MAEAAWFVGGLGMALVGICLVGALDARYANAASRWVGCSIPRLLLLLTLWPVVLPLVWGNAAVRQDADEHEQV